MNTGVMAKKNVTMTQVKMKYRTSLALDRAIISISYGFRRTRKNHVFTLLNACHCPRNEDWRTRSPRAGARKQLRYASRAGVMTQGQWGLWQISCILHIGLQARQTPGAMERGTIDMRLTRPLLMAGGGLVIVVLFFVATLLAIDHYAPDFNGPNIRNRLRGKHAELLMNALEGYRKARGAYPVFPDNEVDDLKPFLVDGGYLAAIPAEPLRQTPGKQYRYAAPDGTDYGLLFNVESAEPTKPSPCLMGTRGRGFWGDPPACPF